MQAILAAFTALDRGDNFVALSALRHAAALPRQAFDAALDVLRRQGTLTLIGCEGRHGIASEDAAAAIRERGELLTHAARR